MLIVFALHSLYYWHCKNKAKSKGLLVWHHWMNGAAVAESQMPPIHFFLSFGWLTPDLRRMAWFRACTHVCAPMCGKCAFVFACVQRTCGVPIRLCVCVCVWRREERVLLLFVRQWVSPSAKWMWMLMSWVIFSSVLKGRHSANWAAWLLQQSATSQMEVDPWDVMAGWEREREWERIEWRKSAQWPPLNTFHQTQWETFDKSAGRNDSLHVWCSPPIGEDFCMVYTSDWPMFMLAFICSNMCTYNVVTQEITGYYVG